MSAINTTTAGSSAAAINSANPDTETATRLAKEDSLQNMTAENEAKRVENVAIQKKKLEVARMKGQNAVLKDQPSRPSRRLVKKNRKPLPVPSNRTHHTKVTVAKKKAIAEQERLAPLRVVRPSYSYGDIIEQRVVDGVVERVTQIDDAPRTAPSVVNPGSDEDVPQLVSEIASPEQVTESEDDENSAEAAGTTASSHIYVDVPMVDADEETIFEKSPCSPSAILSMPNAALYPSRLSRDCEAALVAMHVAPVSLPIAEAKQQKLNKAEKKATKTTETPKEVTPVESKVVQKLPKTDSTETTTDVAEPIVTAEEPGYVATLLARPNGPGMTKESRDLHEKLVAIHVAPLSLPVSAPKQQKQQKTSKAERKATKTEQKMSVEVEKEEPDFVALLLSKPNGPGETKEARELNDNLVETHVAPLELPFSQARQKKAKNSTKTPVAEPVATNEPISAISEPNTADPTRDEPPVTVAPRIEQFPAPIPSTPTATEDEQLPAILHIEDIAAEQSIVIPSSSAATTSTPPASDTSTLKSTKTSRRSSTHSSTSIRRSAAKARSTFLGPISLETFITTLDFEFCDGTTTKDDTCSAFTTLAGLPTTSLHTSTKMQRKIKLGGTSLYGFLRQLDFDDEDVTVVGEVMRVLTREAAVGSAETKLDVALWLAEQDEAGRRGRGSGRGSVASSM